MSNKDLLKLENEYRNELPKYKEKPKITSLPKPIQLTERISEFLENIKTDPPHNSNQIINVDAIPIDKTNRQVEMDLYIAPIDDE